MLCSYEKYKEKVAEIIEKKKRLGYFNNIQNKIPALKKWLSGESWYFLLPTHFDYVKVVKKIKSPTLEDVIEYMVEHCLENLDEIKEKRIL